MAVPIPLQRHPILVVGIALVLAALGGRLAGHRSTHAPAPEKVLTASVGDMLLNYPASWQQASRPPQLPGLALSPSLALAPGGNASTAGLLAGQLAGSEQQAPLPGAFVSQLREPPRTEVVNLLGNQAYRYTGVQVNGFADALTLITVPTQAGGAATVVCYAAPGAAEQMRECERIASGVSLVEQAQSYSLTPDPVYAKQLAAVIAPLQQQRAAARAQLAAAPALAQVRADAQTLSGAFAGAASALGALSPSATTTRAQTALAEALTRASRAYATLEARAHEQEYSALSAARSAVYEAEKAVNAALEGFSLLGYT